jgi:hypothetical protein
VNSGPWPVTIQAPWWKSSAALFPTASSGSNEVGDYRRISRRPPWIWEAAPDCKQASEALRGAPKCNVSEERARHASEASATTGSAAKVKPIRRNVDLERAYAFVIAFHPTGVV